MTATPRARPRARAAASSTPSTYVVPAVLVCCLIGYAFGVLLLDARGLWGDEAFSVWASKQPVSALIGGLDAQPPLYHLMLGAARALFGESVFAVRYLSLFCGIALIPLGARLAHRLAGPLAAVFVAAVLATSPILIYYEQEARMYAPAAMFAAAAMLLATRLMKNLGRKSSDQSGFWVLGSWFFYLLLSVAALFTHFYTVGVLLANSIALGLVALHSRNVRRMVEWVVAHAGIALVFGGWFFGLQSKYVSGSSAARSRVVPVPAEIAANVGRGLEGLLFGMRADGSLQWLAFVLFALAVLGLIGYWRAKRRGVALLVGGWIGLSLGLVLLTAGKTGIVSDFNPRYFLFALLPLVLAAAGSLMRMWNVKRGAGRDRRPSPFALIPALFVVPALIGNAQLLDTSWQKSRYGALVSDLLARSKPGDAIVLVNSDQFPLIDYYGPTGLPEWIVDNNALGGDRAALQAKFDEFTAQAKRVWLVNYGWAMSLQPRSAIEQMLNGKGAHTYSQGYQDAALAMYDLRAAGDGAPITPKEVDFDGQIKLTGVRERSLVYAPGDALTLDLLWQALQTPKADYTVFMHLRRASDGGQIAAFDSAPVNGQSPTSSWPVGQTITDTRAVQIPADAQPGEYNVVIGWYLYPSFERLAIRGANTNEVVVSTVTIGK